MIDLLSEDSNGMSFGIYLTGFVVVIIGLIYGASLMHVPPHWIVVGGLVLVGIGILTGVKVTRQKDSST
jgi:protein-S-isoprenylcysteine O-methyltransferase Ste14